LLSAASARTGSKTLLIDANIHAPVQGKLFGVNPADPAGVFASPEELIKSIQPSAEANLDLVAVSSENPSVACGLAESLDWGHAFDELRASYQWIVVDLPGVLLTSEAAYVAAKADAVVVVVQAGRSTPMTLERTVSGLSNAGAKIAGSVMNRIV
jgi:tyrosine-protein kinase Etk/Wzc